MFVIEAELAIDGGKDALDLAEGEHTTEEGVAGVMAVGRLVEDSARLVGEGHAVIDAVIDTHGQ